jgi:hypothetical protein
MIRMLSPYPIWPWITWKAVCPGRPRGTGDTATTGTLLNLHAVQALEYDRIRKHLPKSNMSTPMPGVTISALNVDHNPALSSSHILNIHGHHIQVCNNVDFILIVYKSNQETVRAFLMTVMRRFLQSSRIPHLTINRGLQLVVMRQSHPPARALDQAQGRSLPRFVIPTIKKIYRLRCKAW